MRRRQLLALAASLPFARVAAAPIDDARPRLDDFDALWRAIDTGYAYFDSSHVAWKHARDRWRAKAGRAKTRSDFVLALEGALAHLCDDSVTLGEQAEESTRRVPAETDTWAEWKSGDACITAVRAFSEADVAGLRPGHVVTHVDGVPVDRAVRERLRALAVSGDAAMAWGLRHLLAGPRAGTLRLALRAGRPAVNNESDATRVSIERGAAPMGGNGAAFMARRMGEERDLGYVRIGSSLADRAFAERVDRVIGDLRGTRAMILDLRDAAIGGDRTVTRALLARFVERPSPWQLRAPAGGTRIADVASPGADPYRAPLVVLVDRWTAGEGEALAAGLDAAANATLVGTPMAGLRGETREVKLPHSGIAVRFPAERTFHVNGTPRERLKPDVEIDLAAPSGGPGDPILYQALKVAESEKKKAPAVERG